MSDDSGRPSDAAVTAGEFAAFLENRLPVRTDLAWMLSGFFDATPLVRRRTPGPWDTVHMPSLRGMPAEGLDDAPLALDERPECAAAVTAFVDREVRLVDGAVFARLHPVVDRAEAFDGPYDRLYVTRAGTFAQPVRKPGAMPPLPVKPGREASDRVARALALIDGVALPDDDLVAMANALPGGILPVLAPASDGRGRLLPDALRQACAGARARITALHRLGERGMADRDGLAEAFEAMAQADRLLAEAEGRGFAVRPGARKIRAYLLEALPRLSPPAPDDDADIAALAP